MLRFLIYSWIVFFALNVSAQKKRFDTRIFAGPEFCLSTNFPKSEIGDARVGFTGGAELIINMNSKRYYIAGLNYTNYSIYRDLPILSPNQADKSVTFRNNSFELPLGIGLNLSKTRPQGLYTHLCLVNNFSFGSKSVILYDEQGVEASRILSNSPIGFYNLGAKIEAGYKTPFSGNTMCTYGIYLKPMFWNLTSSNPKYTTWSTGFIFGFIF